MKLNVTSVVLQSVVFYQSVIVLSCILEPIPAHSDTSRSFLADLATDTHCACTL